MATSTKKVKDTSQQKNFTHNEQRKQYTTTESVDHNRWLEAKQGSFGF